MPVFAMFLGVFIIIEGFMMTDGIRYLANQDCHDPLIFSQMFMVHASVVAGGVTMAMYIIINLSVIISDFLYHQSIEQISRGIYDRIIGNPVRGRDDAYTEF